jgi:hypothetical protein
MLTLEEEIKQAICFFGVMDVPTIQRKISMRRNESGDFKQIGIPAIRQALKNLLRFRAIRKATGVTDGWALVNP